MSTRLCLSVERIGNKAYALLEAEGLSLAVAIRFALSHGYEFPKCALAEEQPEGVSLRSGPNAVLFKAPSDDDPTLAKLYQRLLRFLEEDQAAATAPVLAMAT